MKRIPWFVLVVTMSAGCPPPPPPPADLGGCDPEKGPLENRLTV